MLKKVLFAAAVTGLLAGAAIPLQPVSAEAASGCSKEGMQSLLEGPQNRRIGLPRRPPKQTVISQRELC